jgi:hypothetical protein
MIEAICLIGGLAFWWLYFGLESWLNGAMGGPELPFVEWWRELCWNLPGSWGMHFRMKQTCNDAEWAMRLPGPLHFAITCVLLPLGPWLIFKAIQ